MNKYVVSCIQRGFPAQDWQEAEKVLTLYCGDRLAYPHQELLPFMDARKLQRWRNHTQLHIIRMSEGNLHRLRLYAMQEARNARKPAGEVSFPYADWLEEAGKLRGIETIDYNNRIALIRADLDKVGQALEAARGLWQKNILDHDVRVDCSFFLAFQFPGNAWTQLLSAGAEADVLGSHWQQTLSERLKTQVIDYTCSDTMGHLSYSLYDSGTLTEQMRTDSDDWGYGNTFVSHRSGVTIADLDEISRFAISQQLFIEEQAYEPGIEQEDLLCTPGEPHPAVSYQRWKKVCLPNRGEDTRGYKGRSLLQRIDYIGFGAA